ncbi:MAG: dynamin family protein [Melioribacteraceae bacterium]|nr:dynamin family protein [Melioribacteraceae bacterium]
MELIDQHQELLDEVHLIKSKLKPLNLSSDILDKIQYLNSKETYDIAFIGEFSSGKSSIINAILKKDILPTDLNPSTAKITYISYSDEPKIVISYYDDSQKTVEYSDDYIKSLSAQNHELLNDISYIEVFYPFELLKNNIRFIDTPGTNDTDLSRIEITYQILPNVDLIIYTTIYPVTANNLSVFNEHVLGNYFSKTFIVLNKIDLLPDYKLLEEEIIELFTKDQSIAINNVYGISAIDYLEGIFDNDESLIEKSNFISFSESLFEFLKSTEKYSIQNHRFLTLLSEAKRQLKDIVSLKIESLSLPEDIFQQRNDEIKSKLDLYQKNADKMIEDVESEFDRLFNKVNISLDKLISEIIQSIDMIFSSQNIDINLVQKQIELDVRKKFEFWNDRNKNLISNYIESIYKEINARLGEAKLQMKAALAVVSNNQLSSFAMQNSHASANVPTLDEKKSGLMLSFASVGGYALMASAGLALAPAAILIMPIGTYFLHKQKLLQAAAIKDDVINKIQIASIDFKKEIISNLSSSKDNIIHHIKERLHNYIDEITKQLKIVEHDRKKMQEEIDSQIVELNDLLSLL